MALEFWRAHLTRFMALGVLHFASRTENRVVFRVVLGRQNTSVLRVQVGWLRAVLRTSCKKRNESLLPKIGFLFAPGAHAIECCTLVQERLIVQAIGDNLTSTITFAAPAALAVRMPEHSFLPGSNTRFGVDAATHGGVLQPIDVCDALLESNGCLEIALGRQSAGLGVQRVCIIGDFL